MLFTNMELGPVVSIEDPKVYDETCLDLLDRGFIPIAYITDNTHETFKIFEEQPEGKIPIGVFVTVKYLKNYE